MRSVRALGLSLTLTLLLTGCGESSKLYPASKADGVFFSVPKNWTGLSTAALNKYEKSSSDDETDSRQSLVRWQVAYSTDPKVKVSQVFTLKPPTSPLVFVRVRDLTGPEANDFSYNSLRDVITPITQLAEGVDLGVPDFKILEDGEVVEKGARGIQTIYSFSIDGVEQTLNQTSLMSNDRSTLYIFMVRCATTCYTKNKKVIEEIVKSYTVQGAK
ncbi:hypothetical protein A1sIIA65_06515 [Candidatus Planktophila dulcis]|jgi:hypothetical protein|uniref:Lipoprotein n=1 Tax=Candidatus Planktophila dulcis TaxID=1884914 RepID=A0AAD0E611_9ACTN|nr:hypothetical protein [Candidatus Planktophila dulcis]ASY12588.1 hypothetical protein A1s21155_06600 [Candidatus Planktophila dulcis]ASY15156.1 hypothetical protein A1sIA53_06590 [Candidatus Planktophila dulcis]ASY21834.1 hypothetical protein A1sIIA65_06515 [Candidatus Planktophila dulcis]